MDIRIKLDFADHDKTDDLAAISGEGAIRCLLRLWCWSAEHRPTGVLDCKTDIEIERKAKWTGTEGEFIAGCIQVGFMERDEIGVLALHDWKEHQPFVIHAPERKRQAQDAAKARWQRRTAKRVNADSIAVSNADGNAPSPSPSPIPLPITKETTLSETAPTTISSFAEKAANVQSVVVSPKKKKEPPKQLNGYNPVVLWIDAVYRNMHVKTKLVGKDIGLLNALGNMYDKFEYPAMLVAYEQIWRKDMTRPWSVYWFYTHRDLYRSKARPANIAPDPGSDEELEKWMRK